MNTSLLTLVSIAFGGAFGALGRYGLYVALGSLNASFPFATLTVNILGALALGALLEGSALVWHINEHLRAFLVVGVLGAFTTFSTFSMDAIYLYKQAELVKMALYIGLSVSLSLGAFLLGMWLIKALF